MLPYRSLYTPYGSVYRGGTLPLRIGTGRPLYQSPGVVRVGVGVGVARPGAIHVGGHR